MARFPRGHLYTLWRLHHASPQIAPAKQFQSLGTPVIRCKKQDPLVAPDPEKTLSIDHSSVSQLTYLVRGPLGFGPNIWSWVLSWDVPGTLEPFQPFEAPKVNEKVFQATIFRCFCC